MERWPELHDPVMVYAFAGWVDSGYVGAGTVAALAEQMESAKRFATLDLTELLDLQQVRPTVKLDEGGIRSIEWPQIELIAGSLGRDVVLAFGPEPSIKWRDVSAALVDMALRLGVTEAVAVGGMPGFVSHRRPVPVLSTATRRSAAQEIEPLRPDYEGPTGFQTVVQHALGEAGIRSMSLWAQVPQYVAGSHSPPGVRAVLSRIVEIVGVAVDLRIHDERCETYSTRLEEGLAERPDVLDIIDRLDAALPQVASGVELVGEIERYLRSQPDEG